MPLQPATCNKVRGRNLNFFFHDVRRAIRAAQHHVGFVVADHLFRLRIKLQRAAEAVRCVGQMHERRGDVRLFDRRVDFARVARANAIDEVRVVIAAGFAVRAGLDVVT